MLNGCYKSKLKAWKLEWTYQNMVQWLDLLKMAMNHQVISQEEISSQAELRSTNTCWGKILYYIDKYKSIKYQTSKLITNISNN
jgi:hypothetical protein